MFYSNTDNKESSDTRQVVDDEMKSILVVDDEPTILRSLSKLLQQTYSDYKIETAASAEEALEIFESEPIDLLITDLKLPEMDGLSLTKNTLQRFPETRSILMTAFGSNDIHCDAYRKGCVAYIEKPFDIDSLLRSVENSLITMPDTDPEPDELVAILRSAAIQEQDLSIRIQQDKTEGLLFLKDGMIQYAELDGLTGVAAIVAMLACKRPKIQIAEGAPGVLQEDLPISWHSLVEAGTLSSVAEQFRLLRQSKEVDSELDQAEKLVRETGERSIRQLLNDFKHRTGLAHLTDKELLGNGPKSFLFHQTLNAEFQQRQVRLRKLVNTGVEHFREQDFEKAKRCWLAALRLDPNCQQAKRNIAVVKKLISSRKLH